MNHGTPSSTPGTIDPRKMLYISDLDGTLLTSRGTLPEGGVERLNRLIDRGLQFSIATARNYDSAHPLLEGLHLRLPVILFNGVYLTDFTTGRELLCSDFISPRIVDDMLKLTEPAGLDPFVYTIGDRHRLYFRNVANPGERAYLKSLDGDERLTPIAEYNIPATEKISGFLLIHHREALEPLYRTLKERHAEDLNLYFAQDVSMPGYYWLQSYHQNANKGNMLKRLAERLDRPLSHIVVFGDYLNDLDMFRVAGRSVAVANALPEVRAEAHETIGHNDEGAVINYLESLGF